ncbi:MAG: hypothetical protein H6704_26210 [Myxococcales bacterium]|nr:hypothetical protein [Myxococcales bacterium]
MDWILVEEVDDDGARLSALRLADGVRRLLYESDYDLPLRPSLHPEGRRVAVDAVARNVLRGEYRARVGLVNLEKPGVGWLRESLDPKWRIGGAVFDDTGGRLALEGAYDGAPLPDIYVYSLAFSGNSVREEVIAGVGNRKQLGCVRPHFLPGGEQLVYLANNRPDGAWEVCLLDLTQSGDSAFGLEGRAPSVLSLALSDGAQAVPEAGLAYSASTRRVVFVGRARGGTRQRVRTVPLAGGACAEVGKSHLRIEDVAVSPEGDRVAWSADGQIWLADVDGGACRSVVQGASDASHRGLAFDAQGGRLLFVTNDPEGARLRAVRLTDRVVETLRDLGDVTVVGVQAVPDDAPMAQRLEALPAAGQSADVGADDAGATVVQRRPPVDDGGPATLVERVEEAPDPEEEEDASADDAAAGADEAAAPAAEAQPADSTAAVELAADAEQAADDEAAGDEAAAAAGSPSVAAADDAAAPEAAQAAPDDAAMADQAAGSAASAPESRAGGGPMTRRGSTTRPRPWGPRPKPRRRQTTTRRRRTRQQGPRPATRPPRRRVTRRRPRSPGARGRGQPGDPAPKPAPGPKASPVRPVAAFAAPTPSTDFVAWMRGLPAHPDPGAELSRLTGLRGDVRVRDAAQLHLSRQLRRLADDPERVTDAVFAISAVALLRMNRGRALLVELCGRARERLDLSGGLPEAEEHFALAALRYVDGRTSAFDPMDVYAEYEAMFTQATEALDRSGEAAAQAVMESFGSLYREQLVQVLDDASPEDEATRARLREAAEDASAAASFEQVDPEAVEWARRRARAEEDAARAASDAARAEAEARAQIEAQARARAEADAKARADAERARLERERDAPGAGAGRGRRAAHRRARGQGRGRAGRGRAAHRRGRGRRGRGRRRGAAAARSGPRGRRRGAAGEPRAPAEPGPAGEPGPPVEPGPQAAQPPAEPSPCSGARPRRRAWRPPPRART